MVPNPQAIPSTPVDVSVVIPCCNEEAGLVRLQRKLRSASLVLKQKYNTHFILVDDGSTDNTWKMMKTFFGDEANCTLLRHRTNLGIGAAILHGIRQAKTEIVCSIDADCSYDPCELENLVPMLVPGVDLVTASPYHPAGEVVDVPCWRLFLSKAATHLYRQVLGQKLYTYTSCFRVYRRSTIVRLKLRRRGFLAVAELIAKLDLQGSVILECPAKLATRSQGASKMKTAQVALGHFKLLGELLAFRIWHMLLNRLRHDRALPDFNGS